MDHSSTPCSKVPTESTVKSEYVTNIDWKAVAARRQHEISGKIPNEYLAPAQLVRQDGINTIRTGGVLTFKEQEIIELSATSLVKSVHSQQYSSVEVVTAYCKSAALAHQVVCCL